MEIWSQWCYSGSGTSKSEGPLVRRSRRIQPRKNGSILTSVKPEARRSKDTKVTKESDEIQAVRGRKKKEEKRRTIDREMPESDGVDRALLRAFPHADPDAGR